VPTTIMIVATGRLVSRHLLPLVRTTTIMTTSSNFVLCEFGRDYECAHIYNNAQGTISEEEIILTSVLFTVAVSLHSKKRNWRSLPIPEDSRIAAAWEASNNVSLNVGL
jgi:hypothetical protein